MKKMADRKLLLVMLWLVAMSSLDLSMGKIFSSFKLSKDKEVRRKLEQRVADNAAYNTFHVNPAAQAASVNVAQNGGLGVNTGPSDNKFNINPAAKGASSNVAQNGGFGVNTAPSANNNFRNPAAQGAPRNVGQNGGFGANRVPFNRFHINPAAQGPSSNVARNGGSGVNTGPSTDNRVNINPGAQAPAQKHGSEVNTAPNLQKGGNMPMNPNIPKHGGFKDRASKHHKGDDDRENRASRHHKDGDMKNRSSKHPNKENDRENTAKENQGRGANYIDEKRNQGRRLAGIMVEKRDQGRKLAEIISSQVKEKVTEDEAPPTYVLFPSDMADKLMDNAPDMARATKLKAEEIAGYAMSMATDMANNAKKKAFNIVSDANSKAPNMASDAANKDSHIETDSKGAGKIEMHTASQYAKNKAFREMNIPSMASDIYKMHAASEYPKHKANRETDIGRDAMNRVKDKVYEAYVFLTPEKIGDALDEASKAFQYASDNVDEKTRTATEKVKEAKERWDIAKVHGKGTTFGSHIDAKARAHEAYQFAKSIMLEIIAMENHEAAKEKVSKSPGNLGAHYDVMGDGVWEL